MAKKSKSKKSNMYYLAAILFSALVIGMAFLPVFTYKGSLTGTTNINAFQLMSGSFSEKFEIGSVAGFVNSTLGEFENVRVASIFLLVAVILAGLSVLFSLACLLTGKNFRLVQFILLALCFAACLVAMILLFVLGGDIKVEVAGNVITNGIVNVGAYLMTLFALIGAGSCLALKK
ncbi:MAG: hypothetical protein ACI4M1_03085 [Christensenellales bacterium]